MMVHHRDIVSLVHHVLINDVTCVICYFVPIRGYNLYFVQLLMIYSAVGHISLLVANFITTKVRRNVLNCSLG